MNSSVGEDETVTLLRSIVMWGAAICAILFALFAGHALAVQETGPLLAALGLLGISALLVVVQGRLARDPTD